MIFKHEKYAKDLSSSTNSNSNIDYDHESNEPNAIIHFIDNLDENNNSNCRNTNIFHPPVKFVTHFSNIKEDEDKDQKNMFYFFTNFNFV